MGGVGCVGGCVMGLRGGRVGQVWSPQQGARWSRGCRRVPLPRRRGGAGGGGDGRPDGGLSRTRTAVWALPGAEAVFDFENVACFPFWLSMVAAPRAEITQRVMRSYAPLLVGAGLYLYLAGVSLSDPAALEGFSTGKPDLAALASAFSLPSTVAVGWAHFIAQDLFVGRALYFDGLRNNVVTRHSLLLTLFFGPAGILSHVLTRAITGAVRGEVMTDLMSDATDPSGERS